MGEAGILLDVPDLQDPVRVESVNATTSLITDKVDDVVVLERRSGSQVDVLEHLSRADIVLRELVLSVEEHELAK